MGVTKGGGLYSWEFPLSFQKVIVGYDKNGLGMVLKYQQDTSVEPPHHTHTSPIEKNLLLEHKVTATS